MPLFVRPRQRSQKETAAAPASAASFTGWTWWSRTASGSSSAFTSSTPGVSALPAPLQGASCNNGSPSASRLRYLWSVPEPTFAPSRPVAHFASLEAALTVIGRTPAVLRGLVDALDAPVLEAGSRPDGGEGWGPRQVAEHLLD